jgi:hypothetical protein
MNETKKKAVRIFWEDGNLWHAQCPFCREINSARNADPIHTCVHFDDADWTFGKAIFKVKDTGIHCPVCLEKFTATDGIRLKDEQILCGKCGLDIENRRVV